MARTLDISNSAHGQPFGTDANAWMQLAYNEQSAAAVIAQIGEAYSAATRYILYGGVLTSAAGTTSVTAGMAFINGIFYEIQAASYPDPVGPNVNRLIAQTTFGDGTGTVFADAFVANVQYLEKLVPSAGASVPSDYVNFVHISNQTFDGGALTNTYTFNRNAYYRRATHTGTDTITLSTTNGRLGCEVIIVCDASVGDTITFAGGVGVILTTGTASLVAPSGTLASVVKLKLISFGAGTKVIGEIYWYQ